MYLMIDENIKVNRNDIYSFNLTKNATPSSALALGGCCISAYTVSFDKRNYNKFYKNSKVEVFNDNDKKMGEFFIDTPDSSNHIITLECSDILKKASVRWKGRSFPCTVYEMFTSVLMQIGISALITLEDLPCGSCVVNESKNLRNMTCIDILSDIAELNGGFFYVDNNGELRFKVFDFENQKEYDENYIHEVSKIEEVLTTRRGLYLVGADNTGYTFGDTYNQLSIVDNEIIKTMTSDGINLVGNTILNIIKYFEYNAAEVSLWQDDKLIELGDVIKIVDIDGNYHSIIVHELSFSNSDNYCNIESYGDDLKTKATEETSQIENDTTITQDSGEIFLGRGQNHQRVLAKAGTYVIAEELVTEVSSFSKVFLNLFIEFNYDYVENRILFFDIYANDKLVKSLRCKTDQGFNQYSVGFLADVDLEKDTNLYSCKVTLLENEILEILEFKGQLTFIVKSCRINDAVATDQKYVERYEKISNTIFNQNRFTIKDLREKVTIKIPFYTFDVSLNNDGSVMADWYEDGSLEIYGNGAIKNDEIYDIAFNVFDSTAYNDIKTKTTNVTIGNGVTTIGNNFFKNMTNIESISIVGNTPITFGSSSCEGCSSLTSINENNIIGIGSYCFKNCDLTGTFDLTNCDTFGYEMFANNRNMDYVSFAKDLIISEGMFKDTYFDSVIILNVNSSGFYGNEFDFSSNTFRNCYISTFILNNEVDIFDCDGNFSNAGGFDNVLAATKTIYLCDNYNHSGDVTRLQNWGFEVIRYEYSEYENIVNEVWR